MNLNREKFITKVNEIVSTALPSISLSEQSDFTIRMKHGDYWIDLYLGNFYNNYLNCPDTGRETYLKGVLQPFIEDLKKGRGVNAEDILTHKERIYPMLVGKQDLDNSIVFTTLYPELYLVYVYDQGLRFFYIDMYTLKELAMDTLSLDKLAKINFHRDLDKPLQVLDKKRGILGYNYHDSYDSARLLLLTKKFGGIEEFLKQEIILMIPSRDLLMIFANNDAAIFNRILMIGRSEYINNPYPVNKSVYKLLNSKLEKYNTVGN